MSRVLTKINNVVSKIFIFNRKIEKGGIFFMDNTTIYEFLQEKSVTPTGPGSYSNSTEISNALKATK